ncbi:MAG: CapA family protein [Ruminococcus sp.]|uniref:CapA family protein n=1 Tax=Ruminococcus sp. TaxID=41978 RepID=UPI001B14B15D|nr:CapA family protein [Ruminococcus sp.]MBO7473737.1 CapA family protein [Ruminococcus sp.]
MKLRKGRAAGALAVLIALVAGGIGCGNIVGKLDSGQQSVSETTTTTVPEETTEELTTLPPDKVVHVTAAGDNLIHHSVMVNARELAGGYGYDFKPLYSEVKYLIEGADLAILNQETVISESNEPRGAEGGVLIFNSPPEVADAVIDLGFDVFTMANNHLLDMGTDGLEESINFWNRKAAEKDLTVLGAYLNEEDANRIRTREVNGVKIAFLAYAHHINGFESLLNDVPLRVIMNEEEDVIERQIKEAKQMADVVIVSAHWGQDDTTVVTEDRIELANKMVNWGADVILGCHTHTAETMEWIERDDGTKGFVYYSMGNFICAQTDNFNVVGELPDFDIVIDGETNELRLENVGCIPTIIHYEGGFSNMKVYPYSKYSPELAERHGLPYAVPQGTYTDFGWDVINSIIEEQIPAEFRKLNK